MSSLEVQIACFVCECYCCCIFFLSSYFYSSSYLNPSFLTDIHSPSNHVVFPPCLWRFICGFSFPQTSSLVCMFTLLFILSSHFCTLYPHQVQHDRFLATSNLSIHTKAKMLTKKKKRTTIETQPPKNCLSQLIKTNSLLFCIASG